MGDAKRNGKGGWVRAAKQTAVVAKGTEGNGTLAFMIDPFLLAGGMTVKEIAGELATKAADAAKGKDLAANVRARMVSYTRKGWRVVKDDEKRVKVVQP